MKKKYIIMLHVLFWVYYFFQDLMEFHNETKTVSFPIFDFDHNNPANTLLLSFSILYVFIFYLNYLVFMPKFFDVKNVKRIIFSFLGLFFIFIISRYLIEEVLFWKLFGYHNYYDGVPIAYYIYDNLYYGSRPIVASSILWFIINMLRLQKEQIELVESRNETEINFLKSQLNPHFIFNTLNNIFCRKCNSSGWRNCA